MIVLGLDLSLTATGWVALRCDDDTTDKRPAVLGFACIGPFETPKTDEQRVIRIQKIVEEISDAILDHKPNLIAIEDYSYQSVEQAHRIGELNGVLMNFLWRTAQVYDRIPIGQWRKLALGNGQLAKDQVRVEVMKRYGEEFKSLDVTEAYGVAIAGWMRRIGARQPLPIRRRREQPELPLVAADPFA